MSLRSTFSIQNNNIYKQLEISWELSDYNSKFGNYMKTLNDTKLIYINLYIPCNSANNTIHIKNIYSIFISDMYAYKIASNIEKDMLDGLLYASMSFLLNYIIDKQLIQNDKLPESISINKANITNTHRYSLGFDSIKSSIPILTLLYNCDIKKKGKTIELEQIHTKIYN